MIFNPLAQLLALVLDLLTHRRPSGRSKARRREHV
jgi:hypothetical protein